MDSVVSAEPGVEEKSRLPLYFGGYAIATGVFGYFEGAFLLLNPGFVIGALVFENLLKLKGSSVMIFVAWVFGVCFLFFFGYLMIWLRKYRLLRVLLIGLLLAGWLYFLLGSIAMIGP